MDALKGFALILGMLVGYLAISILATILAVGSGGLLLIWVIYEKRKYEASLIKEATE